MTDDEFQRKYDKYCVQDVAAAVAEAARVSALGPRVVAVHFAGIGYALMLERAADALAGIGVGFAIIRPTTPEPAP